MSTHLESGIQALKSGDRDAARRHLAQALREDPNSERAWQWMFNAANNDTERTKCIREILRINPENEKARRTLNSLDGSAGQPIETSTPSHDRKLTSRPWYRSTAIYVILFFLFPPALAALVLTDKDEHKWVKIVTSIQVAIFFIPFCVVLSLTISGPLISDTFDAIGRDLEEGSAQPIIAATATATNRATIVAQATSAPANTPAPTNTPAPIFTPTPAVGTISNPYPFRSDVDLVYTTTDGKTSEFRIQVVEIMRGERANMLVERANMFNDKPLVGTTWMLINIRITLDSGAALFMSGYDFSVLSGGKIFSGFDNQNACCLSDAGLAEFETNIAIPGTTTTGWIARLVGTQDTKPLLVINLDEFNTDLSQGLYFALYE